jgi:hypothetical protein
MRTTLDRLFIAHPRAVNENYLEAGAVARASSRSVTRKRTADGAPDMRVIYRLASTRPALERRAAAGALLRGVHGRDIGLWHFCDIVIGRADLRSWGKSASRSGADYVC